jgi:hypothetical protein
MSHVILFSGGIGSWAAARRLADQGIKPVLLFTDTLMEDEDLYRFIGEAAAEIGVPLVTLTEGRTPWQVFRDVRFLGNSRIDPCSRILKRELARQWVNDNCDPASDIIILGIDWTEAHRLERARNYWQPYQVEAPMCDPPYRVKSEMVEWAVSRGLVPPRLYGMGFPHNNCGGFCVKAGQANFALLLRTMPERYAWHEQQEEALGKHLGRKVTAMKDRRGGVTAPLSMREFRGRVCANRPFDGEDWGGCGCMLDDAAVGEG